MIRWMSRTHLRLVAFEETTTSTPSPVHPPLVPSTACIDWRCNNRLRLPTRLPNTVFLRCCNDFVGNRLRLIEIVHLQPAGFA